VRYVLVAALSRARQLGWRLAAGPCLTVLRMPQTDGWCGSRPVGGRSREPSAPGNAAHARRSAPSHHGCLQLLGLDGPVGVTAAGEAPIANQGHGHAGVLGHHGGAGGKFKFAAPALRLLAFWVERWVVPPAPYVNITMFEVCNLVRETSHGQACCSVEDLNRGHTRTVNRKGQ
jgi:hypothetical protein